MAEHEGAEQAQAKPMTRNQEAQPCQRGVDWTRQSGERHF